MTNAPTPSQILVLVRIVISFRRFKAVGLIAPPVHFQNAAIEIGANRPHTMVVAHDRPARSQNLELFQ